MSPSHHLLLLLAIFVSLISLSGGHARVLPKVKRDNSTCCAYKVANRGGYYFGHSHTIDFSTLTSMSQVYEAGWTVSTGYQAGAKNPTTGQTPIASENNVKLVPGKGLTLTVPGRQSPTARTFSVAEIIFPDIALGGIFQVEAQMTSEPGVVFAVFSQAADEWSGAPAGWQDEMDIEILSSAIMTPNAYHQAGIQMTEVDPNTGAMAETVWGLPSNPTVGMHTYAIGWFPVTCANPINTPRVSAYRYDGLNMNGPAQYASIHPSNFYINLWTNSDPYFSAGPPANDAVVTIKKVTAYYDKPNKIANGACVQQVACTPATACSVNI